MEQNELISGSGGKGKHPHVPVESNDTLKSKQTIKLLFAVAEGEITSIDDVLLDKVSISSYKASYSWKSGLSNQTVIPGFIDTESPLPTFISVQLIHATFFTYNIDSSVDAVRLTLGVDSLRQIQGNGDMTGYSVSIDIYTKATTSSSQILYITSTKNGKASNPYSWDIIVNRPTNYISGTNWSVVINRSSADDSSVKNNSITRLIAITQIYHKQLTYPGTALVALTLNDAGEFGGQIPQILIKGKGRKVLVPSNYNPTTRIYTGTWDLSMSSVKQFTDNIAWVLYDVLHDSTCLGIDTADIDKTSFYLLSQYADILIPDGYGNNIPRYSIGNQFYARDNVPTFIQNLLSLCNGMLTENEFGQIKVIFDQPNLSASRLVTNANVVGGLFNYSSNDLENRYSLVNITYNNYLSYNETDTATWSDDALITRYGLQTSDIVLPGCIYEAQAIRKARWAVYTNAITTKLLTFNVMFEALSFRNGSIIKVMDSDNAGVNQHGIIVSTSITLGTTTIVMDRSITLAAQTYTVTFYTTDGITLYTKTLLESNVTVSSISYVGIEVPLVGSTFILSATVVPQLFRVVGNSKNNDEYTISCIVYDNAKFTYIDQGITLTSGTGDFISVGSFYAPAVVNLAVDNISFNTGTLSNVQLHVHWDWDLLHAEKYKATFQATWIRDNTDLKEIKDITGNSFDINGAVPGTYDITVWAINPFSGIKSTPATLSYAYRTTAGTSTLLPPVNARVSGTVGLIYNTPALSLLFDYNTSNSLVSDSLLDYVVELWTLTGTTKVGTYVVKPDSAFGGTFNFPFLENLAIFGELTRSYIIKLYSRDLTGFVSTAYAVTVDNTVPAIQSYTIFSGLSSIYIRVTTTPEIDVTGYVVHRSLTSGFTPAVGTLVYQGPDTYITLNVPDTQTYYYRIAAYDSFGTTGLTYSSEQSNTALSLDAITWTKTGLVFAIGTTNQLTWTSGTIVKAGTTTYTIVAGNATWTTGTLYAYFNPAVSTTVIQTTTTLGTAVGVGCYPIATYTGGAVTNIKGGTGEAFISGSQIIAGTVGASQIIAGSIVASLLDTTNAVITGEAQIGSAVINNAAIKDYIQSTVYTTTGTSRTGWKLDKAGNITTYGTLQILDNSGNVVLSSGSNPSFDFSYVGGTTKPDSNATRNVFKGDWKGTTTPITNYLVGDIVLDSIGYGWSCVQIHTSVTGSTQPPVYPTSSNTYWTLYAVKGIDAVSVILSNDTHTLPATSDGTVSSYVGSGTTVQVFDGTREVIYDAVGTSNGTWKVVATPTNITVGTLTDSGNYLTVGVQSGVAADIDTASISYAITGKTFNGSAISITAQQSFSKSKAGAAGTPATYVTVTGEQAFKFATGSATPTSTNITLTAALTGGLTTYQWDYWNGTAWTTLSGTVNTSTYTLAYNNAAFTANSLRVRCISETAFDEITIVKLYDGATGVSAVSGYLTNETVAVATASDGTGAIYTSAGGTFKVFNGTTDVTTSTAFTTTAAVSGLTLTIGAATGVYSLAGIWTSDTASFTLTGVYSGTTITKVYKITKAKAGVDGGSGDSVDIVFVRSATVPAIPTASTGVPTAPITWYTTVAAANTAGGIVNPLYSSTGFKVGSVGNYTWDTPVRIDGTAVAEVTVFVRSATVPATPTTGGTYTFSATPVVVAPTAPIAWSISVPSGTNPVYTSRAVVSTSSTNTAAVAISGWSTPVISLQNGTDGAQGPTVQITTNRTATFLSNDDTLIASQANIVCSLILSGITATSYAWTFYVDGATTPSVLSGVTVNASTCTITQANFAAASTQTKALKVICIVNGIAAYTDHINIVRLDNSTAAPGATVGAGLYSTYTVTSAAFVTGMTTTAGVYDTVYTPATGNLVSTGSYAITASSANILTTAIHGLTTGTRILYTCVGTTISGLTSGTSYYVVVITTTTFKLATTAANALAATPVVITLGALTVGSTYAITGNDWLFSGYSTTSVAAASGIKLTFTATSIVGSYMVGFSTDPTTSSSYTTIDYAIYLANSQYSVYENGVNKGNFGVCIVGDTFAITYNGSTLINYYINGINFYSTVLSTALTLPLFVDTSITTANTTIYGIGFSTYVAPTLVTSGNLIGKIHPGNASTYIASAAIQSALIGDAQITTAKIGALAVNTLQVAGNAVGFIVASASPLTTYSTSVLGWATIATITVNMSGSTANGKVLLQITATKPFAASAFSPPDYINGIRIINQATSVVIASAIFPFSYQDSNGTEVNVYGTANAFAVDTQSTNITYAFQISWNTYYTNAASSDRVSFSIAATGVKSSV